MPQEVSKEAIQQIVLDFLKQKKNTQRIDVSTIEQKKDTWIIRGTCPIDLEGHPWAEKFEVAIDTKGKIRSSYFTLL
jgi:hypothetical protein